MLYTRAMTGTNPDWIQTKDKSYTLKMSGETMHSLDGALGETDYIYGEAVRRALEQDWLPSFLIVGLGLGYVEWVTIAICAERGIEPNILSFESDEFLRNAFGKFWVGGSIFERPIKDVSEFFGRDILPLARSAVESGRW